MNQSCSEYENWLELFSNNNLLNLFTNLCSLKNNQKTKVMQEKITFNPSSGDPLIIDF